MPVYRARKAPPGTTVRRALLRASWAWAGIDRQWAHTLGMRGLNMDPTWMPDDNWIVWPRAGVGVAAARRMAILLGQNGPPAEA